MSISVHREGVNPSSMEGVLDLSDHISVILLLSECKTEFGQSYDPRSGETLSDVCSSKTLN